MSSSSEFKLLPARLVPLSAEQEGEAVALFAELLLDVAQKRPAGVFGSASVSASGGDCRSVVPFPENPGKARKAA